VAAHPTASGTRCHQAGAPTGASVHISVRPIAIVSEPPRNVTSAVSGPGSSEYSRPSRLSSAPSLLTLLTRPIPAQPPPGGVGRRMYGAPLRDRAIGGRARGVGRTTL